MDQRTVDRQRSQVLSTLAYLGLGLVIVGSLYPPAEGLSLLGLLLIAVGGFGLLALSRQQMTRPLPGREDTPPTQSPIPNPVPLFVPLPPLPPSLPSASEPAPGTARFDLSSAAARYQAHNRTGLLLRTGMAVFLFVLGGYLVVVGSSRSEWTVLPFGGGLIALGAFLFYVLAAVDRAPVAVTIDDRALRFEFPGRVEQVLEWTDPRFGFQVILFPAEVTRNWDPPRDGPLYRFFSGYGSGVGYGRRVLSDLSPECVALLLRVAESRGLRPTPISSGVPGTLSERFVYRVARAAPV
jgi:hypothetical protein